jgi:hypothetical protein
LLSASLLLGVQSNKIPYISREVKDSHDKKKWEPHCPFVFVE